MDDIDRMTIEQIEKKLDAIEEEHENYDSGGTDIAELMRCVRAQRKRNQFFRELMERGEVYDESEHGSFELELVIGDRRHDVRGVEPLPDPFYRRARDKALSDTEDVIKEYHELKARFGGDVGSQEMDYGESQEIERGNDDEIGGRAFVYVLKRPGQEKVCKVGYTAVSSKGRSRDYTDGEWEVFTEFEMLKWLAQRTERAAHRALKDYWLDPKMTGGSAREVFLLGPHDAETIVKQVCAEQRYIAIKELEMEIVPNEYWAHRIQEKDDKIREKDDKITIISSELEDLSQKNKKLRRRTLALELNYGVVFLLIFLLIVFILIQIK